MGSNPTRRIELMHSDETVATVLALRNSGLNAAEISRHTGVARTTICNWLRGQVPRKGGVRARGRCLRCAGYLFPVPNATEVAYAQLLGLYLGDGCISRHARGVHRLRISLDRAYPAIVGECSALITILAPDNAVTVIRHRHQRVDEPSAYSKHWPCLFPQHGPGMKHQRPIVLEPWQRALVDRHPWRFLRGLIQSDGCRSINTIRHPKRTYAYPRYEFSNRSDDIRGLFGEYCDRVGVEWRRMNRWTISVARRESVAQMDRHIGPKR